MDCDCRPVKAITAAETVAGGKRGSATRARSRTGCAKRILNDLPQRYQTSNMSRQAFLCLQPCFFVVVVVIEEMTCFSALLRFHV